VVLAHFTACRHIVVRQSGEFHGRPGLDDRCRGSPDYRGTRRHRLAWLLSVAGDSHQVALCGAMIGFAFFNRPVAKLFLGDVGSLPIGVLLGWLLLVLARSSGRVAAFATAAILSCRQHHHAPAPGSKSRNGLAGPSIALLSTRHRRRFSRH